MVDALLRIAEGWKQEALAQGLVSESELRVAEASAQASHRNVADMLVHSGKLTEEQIAQLKAEAAELAYVDVHQYQIDPKALELIPEPVARKHLLLPLYRLGHALTVAMVDPWNAVAIDEVRLCTKLPVIQPVLGAPSAIRKAIDRHYSHKVVEEASAQPPMTTPVAERTARVPERRQTGAVVSAPATSDVPVAKLVDALFAEALESKASDIHLEPEEERVRVRYRIDGVLQEVKMFPMDLHEAIASRIKLMAKLDITEHRLPQDGHLSMSIENRLIDLRISTYPTVFGENLVIRLLDHGSLSLDLDELGFAPDVLKQFVALVNHPHGMVLVTGPTGSGKTTTLYAALAMINSITKNIMTIEDPVEYRLPLIRQTQLNPKAGVTFATGLRSLLRQDPDVIMVGEIRDRDTAEIAIHAALTGHLVLSTLHTNDAVGAIARLLDMGVEPYLMSSTLLGVVAQRLVRRICTHCQEGRRPEAEIHQRYPDLEVLYRGRGCRFCRETGFAGRVGVFELFGVDEQAKTLIASRRPSDELTRYALACGMRSMRADGMLKVQQGLISLDELDRVVPRDALSSCQPPNLPTSSSEKTS